jgi:hypothetical protein
MKKNDLKLRHFKTLKTTTYSKGMIMFLYKQHLK